jgi:hypothetical protein
MQLDDLFGSDGPHETFHDASIERLTLDYVARKAVLDCSICIGDPDSTDVDTREARRRGRLTFLGLWYCVIDPPDSTYPYKPGEGLWLVDDGPVGTSGVSGARLPPNVPDGAFVHYLYIRDLNAFIYIGGESVRFEWAD